jgi:chromosome segregation ATPase
LSGFQASRTFGRLDDARHEVIARSRSGARLASAIALEAGARRDLQVAEQAVEHAQRSCWQAQSALDELQRTPIAPKSSFASQLAASIASGKACNDVGVLERPRDDVRARIATIEKEIAVWQEAISECEAAVSNKAAEVLAAQERVTRAASVVIANAETVKRLGDDLEALQTDVVNARSVLRFLWGKGVNGELPTPLKERVERLLWRDLLGMESTPASLEWAAAYTALLTDPDAGMPSCADAKSV